ncbi:MAG: hypothetical protein HFJ37_04915 [Clostridia bacterium]|nr:hypothetical protein [Clostridia bacterium]
MNYKIEGAIKRNRKNFIIFAILWIFIAIVFVSPFSYSSHIAGQSGKFDMTLFIETFTKSIANPFVTLGNILASGATSSYISALLVTTIFYSVFFFIGFVRSAPKNEYSDIEHGSSDWSQRGEQYQILNRNKGIVLAEDNYLPVDKRGNVNVLVVGRIRFW